MKTKLEIGVVVGVLAIIILAVAVPWIKNERIKANRAKCIYILTTVDAAKQQWALEHIPRSNADPTWKDIQPYGGRGGDEVSFDFRVKVYTDWYSSNYPPHCPSGGTYTLGKVADPPTCSFPGHILN